MDHCIVDLFIFQDELPDDELYLLDGLTGMKIPTDQDKLAETQRQIEVMKTTADKKNPNFKVGIHQNILKN